MSGYSGTPLADKLGFKSGHVACYVNPPQGFDDLLGALPDGVRVQSALSGPLDLIVCFVTSRRATATFSILTFSVPGAAVELAGRYGIRSADLDFHGDLRMQATLSEAAGGGVKSILLKAADPFFRKDGAGTVLPIKITGNRKNPQFGLELFGKK